AEPVTVGALHERERAQCEVACIARQLVRTLALDLDHELAGRLDGHLVPQVERGGRGVETGAEVRARRGCDHPGHAIASRTASIVGSTVSAESSATAAASLSPWPVRMQTTVPAAPTPVCSSAARPAAEAGSQKTPSSRATRLHAARNSSS